MTGRLDKYMKVQLYKCSYEKYLVSVVSDVNISVLQILQKCN